MARDEADWLLAKTAPWDKAAKKNEARHKMGTWKKRLLKDIGKRIPRQGYTIGIHWNTMGTYNLQRQKQVRVETSIARQATAKPAMVVGRMYVAGKKPVE